MSLADQIAALTQRVAAVVKGKPDPYLISSQGARTSNLAQIMKAQLGTVNAWCTARGVKGYLAEFGIPMIPSNVAATYAFLGERARWESLMESVMVAADAGGMHMTYWDVQERNNTGNGAPLSAYVRTNTGDYRDALQDGVANTPTPAGLVLERHIKMGRLAGGATPKRGINYSMGSWGGRYDFANSASLSNTRDSLAYAISPNIGVNSYNYGSPGTYTYLASRGITFVRLSVRFERLFRNSTPAAPVLDPVELQRLMDALTSAGNVGVTCMLSNHAQGAFWLDNGATGVPKEIGNASYTVAMYAAMWGILAQALAGHTGFGGYGLDNEPGGGGNPMTSATWDAAAQAAVTAIRVYDAASLISVPVYQSSVFAPELGGNGFIADPNNNFVYEFHYYPDGSGNFTTSYDTIQANAIGAAAGNVAPYLAPDDNFDLRASSVTLRQAATSAFWTYDRNDVLYHAKRSAWYRNLGKLRNYSDDTGQDIITIDQVTGEITMKDGEWVARAPRSGRVVLAAAPTIDQDAAWSNFFNAGIPLSLGGFGAATVNNFGTWLIDLARGTWSIRYLYCKSTNVGISTIDISMDGGVTWVTLGTVDGYSATFTWAQAVFTGVVLPQPTAAPRFRLRALSKNASSTNFAQEPIVVEAVRTA